MARTAGKHDVRGRTAQAEANRLAEEVAQLRTELAERNAAVAAAHAQLEDSRAAAARVASERDEARAALQSAQATVEDLREALAALRAERTRAAWGASAEEPHPVTYDLMTVADRLSELTHGSRVDPAQAATVARWLGNRVRMMLARCDVAPATSGGPVDPVRHEVVGRRDAPIPALVDHIAETVQPGYIWRGRLLRTQGVIAYAVPASGRYGTGLAPNGEPYVALEPTLAPPVPAGLREPAAPPERAPASEPAEPPDETPEPARAPGLGETPEPARPDLPQALEQGSAVGNRDHPGAARPDTPEPVAAEPVAPAQPEKEPQAVRPDEPNEVDPPPVTPTVDDGAPSHGPAPTNGVGLTSPSNIADADAGGIGKQTVDSVGGGAEKSGGEESTETTATGSGPVVPRQESPLT